MERREFFGVSGKGAVGLALVAATADVFVLEGCDVGSVLSELETWVPVGLSAFDTLISYINPAAGSAIAVAIQAANVLWQAVATAVANYQHTTDPTTTLLDKVIAALDALQGGLASVLASLPTGLSPVIVKAVTFGFSLLLATLKSIQSKLEPAPASTSSKAANVIVNGVAPAKSGKDFIKQFNASVCVVAGYQPRLK